MTLALRCLAAAVLASALAPALAATTTYTNPATFMANAAAGSYSNTFTGPPDAASSYSYSGGGFGYAVTAPPAGFDDDVYLSGSFVGNLYANTTLTVTFTTNNVRAVGGEFFITNSSDLFQAVPVVVTLADGTVASFTPASQAGAFRGFTSTVNIASLTMSAPGSLRYNTIDNLVVGTVSAVPETTTLAMMGLGIAGLVLVRRRRLTAC